MAATNQGNPGVGPVVGDKAPGGTVQADTVQAGTVQAGTVQDGTVQAGTVQAEAVLAEERADGVSPPPAAGPGRQTTPPVETGASSAPAAQGSPGPPGRTDLQGGEDPYLGEVVVSEDEIRSRIMDLGARITADYADRPPLLVGVLKGAFVFMSDLARAIALPVEFDFMAVASYGSSTRTSGVVRIVKDLDTDLSGRHVLVVEDIVDSGLTLAFLLRNLAARQPASLAVCALLVKDVEVSIPELAYVGFRIPRDFVVGYGLDVAERYRNLTCVRRYNGPESLP
jgi:hypoxanthine phosphoribosyltransferase